MVCPACDDVGGMERLILNLKTMYSLWWCPLCGTLNEEATPYHFVSKTPKMAADILARNVSSPGIRPIS